MKASVVLTSGALSKPLYNYTVVGCKLIQEVLSGLHPTSQTLSSKDDEPIKIPNPTTLKPATGQSQPQGLNNNKNRVLGPIARLIILRNPQNSVCNYLGPYIFISQRSLAEPEP